MSLKIGFGITLEGFRRKVFARHPILLVAMSPMSLPFKDSSMTRMLRVARRIKRAKLGVNMAVQSIKTLKIGVNRTKTRKILVK